MTIGIMVMDLHSENSHSLKQKRQIVMSLKEKLRHKFNVSLIESNYQSLWQKIQITVVMAANKKMLAEKVFKQIEDIVFSQYNVRILHIDKDFI
jgi:uncharacterized protein YlxP (DUF503 family)